MVLPKIKKILPIVFIIILSFFCVSCSSNNRNNFETESKKVTVTASTFLQYDFIKQIAKENVNVSIILPPGVESHDFEISAKDIVTASNSSIFLYSGPNVEPWANKIVENLDKNKTATIDVSCGVDFIKNGNTVDPHIWLDPENAIIMIDNILNALCKKDEQNSEFYKTNANEYKEKLLSLDTEIKAVVSSSKVKKMVFASKFAGIYFVKKYGLDYISAYKSCDDEAEPDAGKIAEIINFVKQNKIDYIFCDDENKLKLAKLISDETGAKILKFNNIHTVDKSQIENSSESIYLELMKQNLENLKQGLS